MSFDQITLKNGLRVIGEKIPHFRSVSVGLWIGSGSQYESCAQAGMSHFIEHMVFKGTTHRTARDIAEQMDEVGGQLNAFTSKECTCIYTKVVDEHLRLAVDTVADLAVNPVFDPAEMEKEKGVVLEEIDMAEDSPEDLAHELIMLAKYGDQPVARPILGTAERVSSFTRDEVVSYWQKYYRPENAVFAVAGSYDWDNIVSLAEEFFGSWERGEFVKPEIHTDDVKPTIIRREKDIEQANIVLGFPGLETGNKMGYEYSLFCNVYGGAMSSRLFQKIREESGLAYSVYSYPNSYTDCGMLSVYAATNPRDAKKVIDLILAETRALIDGGISPNEFRKSREQLKSGFIMGQESTSARMQSMGRRLLLLGKTRTESEVLDRVNKMNLDETNALMRKLLGGEIAYAIVSRGVEKIEL